MTDPMRGADDIRYLPWEAKHRQRRSRSARKVRPLRFVPPPPLTIQLLEPHHCRWPIADDPFVFCGAPREGTRSYCVDHLKIAYARKGYA